MAKKFGKIVLFAAAAAAAAAGAYYYFQNKDKLAADLEGCDDDYDDFSEDLDDNGADCSYVALNHDTEEAPFEKLSDVVSDVTAKAEEKVEEKVEEFFDEDDDKAGSAKK